MPTKKYQLGKSKVSHTNSASLHFSKDPLSAVRISGYESAKTESFSKNPFASRASRIRAVSSAKMTTAKSDSAREQHT